MDIHENMIKTLSPLKAMVQLILHHYKEMNSLFYLSGGNSINRQNFKNEFFWLIAKKVYTPFCPIVGISSLSS
ncbi:MAG TPA: hypothetical protein K8V91_05580, partial [[Clostridium] spiroforme]|nr:hypothetical protein [Thomasclavelia spiroformis]